MTAKRETPRVQIALRLEPETVALIDKARGGTMRTPWIEGVLVKAARKAKAAS